MACTVPLPAAPSTDGDCRLCGRQGQPVDKGFASDLTLQDELVGCRDCKVAALLHRGLEVDKYCYHTPLLGRRRKILKLSEDDQRLEFWPLRRSRSSAVSVPVDDMIGVVFGAYTTTFKHQRASQTPQNWAAFSIITTTRTYDFSSGRREVVECCVRGLQKVLWSKPSLSGGITPSEPWSLGLFLWMRLRSRLQEGAAKGMLGSDQMLWIVFMRCAFESKSEVTKSRFINMARKLQEECDVVLSGGDEVKDLCHRYAFQRDRALKIGEDRYLCQIQSALPSAPEALVGSRLALLPPKGKNAGISARPSEVVRPLEGGVGLEIAAPLRTSVRSEDTGGRYSVLSVGSALDADVEAPDSAGTASGIGPLVAGAGAASHGRSGGGGAGGSATLDGVDHATHSIDVGAFPRGLCGSASNLIKL